ncbi:MAG: hypothetical protein ACI8TA_003657 [Cyclobacteriaceae bacterium]|jgi:hypothetical protein
MEQLFKMKYGDLIINMLEASGNTNQTVQAR